MSSPTDVLERYAEALNADPADAAARFYADTIVMRVPGTHAGAGTAVGRAEVLAAHEALHRLTGGTAGPREMLTVLRCDNRVLVRVRFTAHRGVETLDWERTIIYRIDGDRVAEITIFDDDLPQLDAFLTGDRRG